MHDARPQVTIPLSQKKLLKRLIVDAYQRKDRIAPFLSAEIRRATFCEDSALPDNVVLPNRQVSYRLDRGSATQYQMLVYPQDFTDDANQISLLSPIGAALLGLRAGDKMDVFMPARGFQKLHVVGVK